jgi:hypothetical protein
LNGSQFNQLTPVNQTLLTMESSSLFGQQVAGPGKTFSQAICDGSSLLKSDDVREMLAGIQSIREKQDKTDDLLTKMQQENAVLWKEIAVLRQKHAKQQEIVEKLIHFLISIVSSPGQASMKRKAQLMIDSSDRQFFMKGNKKRLVASSNSGPVIHEVTNDERITQLDALTNCSPIATEQLDPVIDEEVTVSGVDNIIDTDSILDPLVEIIDVPEVVPVTTAAATSTTVVSPSSALEPSVSLSSSPPHQNPIAASSSPIPLPAIPLTDQANPSPQLSLDILTNGHSDNAAFTK